MKQLTIDGETADRITVLTLKDYAKYLRKEIRQFKKGDYLHPEDVAGNIRRIEAIEFILKDFQNVKTY
jgi:hypothetical protein